MLLIDVLLIKRNECITHHLYSSNVGKIIVYVSVIFDNNFPIVVIRISIFQQEFLVHNQGRRTRGGGSNGSGTKNTQPAWRDFGSTHLIPETFL